jgi:hypothetical protein
MFGEQAASARSRSGPDDEQAVAAGVGHCGEGDGVR